MTIDYKTNLAETLKALTKMSEDDCYVIAGAINSLLENRLQDVYSVGVSDGVDGRIESKSFNDNLNNLLNGFAGIKSELNSGILEHRTTDGIVFGSLIQAVDHEMSLQKNASLPTDNDSYCSGEVETDTKHRRSLDVHGCGFGYDNEEDDQSFFFKGEAYPTTNNFMEVVENFRKNGINHRSVGMWSDIFERMIVEAYHKGLLEGESKGIQIGRMQVR